jgi:hypothetical protein
MYIHIGEDLTVRLKDIIAIVDRQSSDSSLLIEDFLKKHEAKLNNLAKKSFKSVVITENQIFLSPYSSSTLKKRSNFINMQE